MSCGTCTLCCKLLAIPEIEKPACTWCPSVDKQGGCTIYQTRPQPCRDFSCLWLQSQDRGLSALRQELRPDKSHVVITAQGATFVLHVDPQRPDAHRTGAMAGLVKSMIRNNADIIVVCGDRRTYLNQSHTGSSK